MLILLFVPVVIAAARVVSVVLHRYAANMAPMLMMMAAMVPGTCAIYHGVRYRSRSTWAMGMTYGLLLLSMMWPFLAS